MNYIAYHKDTTVYMRNHRGVKTKHTHFASAAAAKAAITREAKRGAIVADDFRVADAQSFIIIEKTVTVKNLMTGKDVVQPVNTPRCCDVSSEAYWSM
jgi:hypothetical protein